MTIQQLMLKYLIATPPINTSLGIPVKIMTKLSYNEQIDQQLRIRHIFWPNGYALVSESVIAVVALIVCNTTLISQRFLEQDVGVDNPLMLLSQPINNVLGGLNQFSGIQQLFLFGLWAIVGVLIYILVFRLLQVVFGVKHTVDSGVELVRHDLNHGLYRWLASLHDAFLRILLTTLGILAIAGGSLVCFAIASQELNNGLSEPFPANIARFAVSLLAALISVRVVAIGLALLSPKFRNWYTL
jgi:hypothetical protein